MGSTIVAARVAAVLETEMGRFYALFESTYESNVYPQVPRWGCMYFGPIADCMRAIITYAGATEGGIYKERSGQISPSAYIGRWREALANPVSLMTSSATCDFSRIDSAKQPLVRETLKRHGIPVGLVVAIDLIRHPDVVQEILDSVQLGAWRFIGNEFGTVPRHELGYVVAAQKPSLNALPCTVFVLRSNKEQFVEPDYWIRVKDGKMVSSGWAYSTIEKMIALYVPQAERERPGCAEALIRRIRRSVTEATPLSDDQAVEIQLDQAEHKWHTSQFHQMAAKLQCSGTSLIVTTIGEIRNADATYELRSLTDGMVSFASLEKPNNCGQLDLLDAA